MVSGSGLVWIQIQLFKKLVLKTHLIFVKIDSFSPWNWILDLIYIFAVQSSGTTAGWQGLGCNILEVLGAPLHGRCRAGTSTWHLKNSLLKGLCHIFYAILYPSGILEVQGFQMLTNFRCYSTLPWRKFNGLGYTGESGVAYASESSV
jgi:hypothetical protein